MSPRASTPTPPRTHDWPRLKQEQTRRGILEREALVATLRMEILELRAALQQDSLRREELRGHRRRAVGVDMEGTDAELGGLGGLRYGAALAQQPDRPVSGSIAWEDLQGTGSSIDTTPLLWGSPWPAAEQGGETASYVGQA